MTLDYTGFLVDVIKICLQQYSMVSIYNEKEFVNILDKQHLTIVNIDIIDHWSIDKQEQYISIYLNIYKHCKF